MFGGKEEEMKIVLELRVETTAIIKYKYFKNV
jgi:hypothetical protein